MKPLKIVIPFLFGVLGFIGGYFGQVASAEDTTAFFVLGLLVGSTSAALLVFFVPKYVYKFIEFLRNYGNVVLASMISWGAMYLLGLILKP